MNSAERFLKLSVSLLLALDRSRLNSAERFLKLSVSLLLALDRSRLNSAERSLRIAFYIETKDKILYYISFM
ncbi:hypothetical protein FH584_01635 [Leptospira interrogans]|uniref:hypothetical protein n=1 Tax=Leptospira interrogans TaxID=173 RepID=UPI001EF0D095|nr:hypothetical protein [Leptospira interrogans]ULG92657.1 hypothetical protein FH584_01635 [Leptospira interrogans]